MKKKIILLSVLCIIILYVFTYKIEEFTDSSDTTEQIKKAIKEIYLADVEAIRNLSNVATKLQTNGLNIPGTITTSDLNIVNGNASGIFNFGSKANINSLGDINGNSLTVTGDIKGNSLTITGKLETPADHIINCAGRQHINGSEILYILNKDGLVVGKEWGGSGNAHIQGNLTVNTINGITFNANKNRARYIRVGNKMTPSTEIKNRDGSTNESNSILAIDFWHLIQINVLSNGKNISSQKTVTVTPVPGPTTDNLPDRGSSIANILNGIIFSGKPNTDNISNGYSGSSGRHLYEIDLLEEYTIDAIELYNRYYQDKDENKARTTYDVLVSARMNGTIIELISGDKLKSETLIINRRIHTGLWNAIYSKEYLL